MGLPEQERIWRYLSVWMQCTSETDRWTDTHADG